MTYTNIRKRPQGRGNQENEMKTANQKKSQLLKSKKYAGCTGQISNHGCGNKSIQLFADDTQENRDRFPFAKKNAQQSLCVLDIDF